MNFDHAPIICIWEVTRACDLVCQHCRAEAQAAPAAGELSSDEGRALLDHVRAEFGPILFVITGGDPLKRADVYDLAAYGDRLGLRMAITPSATPLLTPAAISRLRDAGVRRMAVSLDGADKATHDRFRGVEGTWERTLAALEAARSLGVESQVNTSIGRHNRDQLEQIADLCAWHGVSQWSVFLLVPTGRADQGQIITAVEHEDIYRRLATIQGRPDCPFAVKTTAGQPYYRVRAQMGIKPPRPPAAPAAGEPAGRRPVGMGGINDGNGFVFVSHTGEICPSGFLPVVAGNVRQERLADIYRSHPLFVRLRQPGSYEGKCGVCEFNRICGGSRSRTWAITGDPFASDPTCIYEPRSLQRHAP